MKKIISILLTVSIILSLITVIPVQAASYDEASYTLTGVQVNDIVGIAKTQVGYHEGNNLSQLDGTYSGSGNYTKYARDLANAGYGASNPNAWCAYFVSWCAMKSGCLNSAVSFFTGVKSCVAASKPYRSNGLSTYHPIKTHTFTKGDIFSKDYTPKAESYTPKKGDIMVCKSHVGLVVSNYDSATNSFLVIDGNNNHMVRSPRTVYLNNSELVGFVTPDYKTTSMPVSHTHSYTYSSDSAHPHSEYRYCSCGHKEYTGAKKLIASCTKCYPLGYVSLTRSFEKTKGTATFYRNDVNNASTYTLKLYKNGNLYNTYSMNSTPYTVSGLPSGEYYAVLYARNSSTGQEVNDNCNSFKIADTYTISYNANGGSNAPSSQIKIEDEPKTLTTSVPTRAHYIFKGWARSKNATVAEYQPGDTYSRNAKVTLYAVWEPETYTIKFDANGGKGKISDTTITYGDAIRIPNDVIYDYSYLKGWSTSKTATTATHKIGMDYKFDANTTLYAIWGTSTWSGGASASLSGSGTEADPYLIQSESDLGYLANKVNSQTTVPTYEYYKLTNNINLAYNEWVPIGLYGNENQYFYGSFDGNGFTISDLYITKENENNIGLFGYVKDSEFKRLTVTGAIEGISSSNTLNIGAIIGYAENTTLNQLNTMYFNIGSIATGTADYSSVGTVAGKTIGGIIDNCESYNSNINLKSGKFTSGMIAGYCGSDITNCRVESTEGGLFSTSATVGSFYIGGLCGTLNKNADKCSVKAPYFSNNIKTTDDSKIGGLVGELSGTAKICSVQFDDSSENSITSTGTGAVKVGGFVGNMTADAKITDCKFDGKTISETTTSSSAYTGGLAGYATAKTNPTVSVNGGQSLSYSALPKKDGYKATWYTDSAFTTPYDFSQILTNDITLYAKWEKGDDTPDIWDGTSTEPAYNPDTKTYTITNGEELAWISDVTNGIITSGTNFPDDISFSGYTIELANDIYLNDISDVENWETTPPERTWLGINSFSGIFNGNEYRIWGLFTTTGLMQRIDSDGTVKNVSITNSFILTNDVGGSISAVNYGKVYNCYSLGNYIKDIEGKIGTVGGIVGIDRASTSIYDSSIIWCFNDSVVEGSTAGGIVGKVIGGHIKSCYNQGRITASCEAGGIIGLFDKGSYRIDYCANEGAITSGFDAGGIIGFSRSQNIESCYNKGMIRADTDGVGWAGGIAGRICGSSIHRCYSLYNSITGSTKGGIFGELFMSGTESPYVYYCYSNYNPLYNKSDDVSIKVYTSSYMSKTDMKDISNLYSYSDNGWITNEKLNSGYPYPRYIEKFLTTYTVTAVVDEDNSAINRAFVNVDGDISATAGLYAFAGSVLGYGYGSGNAASVNKNIVGMADNVLSSTTGSSYTAYTGNVIGRNDNNKFSFENVYYNSEMNVESSTNTIDTTGIARSSKTMNTAFYTNLLGLTPYTSLANVANDNKAVWVIENGKLPELYYNCLNDITISDDIENGSVTIDKVQAVDGEIVTVTATPNDGYVLNKVYVDGVEQDGTTFVVDGNDEVYVTFAEKIPTFNVSITANENASASLVNADAAVPMLMSVMSLSTSDESAIIANDGEEIQVNAVADSDYTVDSIYVNGEEVFGNSFILTADSVVTMDVTSINTDAKAITNDVEDVGSYFALVSGSISGEDENTVKYIRYWSADDVETVYVTETESGSGDYTAELMDLEPETTYYYQMTEFGEVKSFVTLAESDYDDEYISDEDGDGETSVTPITATTYKTLTSTYKFSIECSQALTTEFLAIACYDNNGKLLALKQIECDGDTSYTVSVPIDANVDYAKIFVWSSASSLKPLAGVEVVDITN